ncbi:MAG: hypothetical protein CSA81_01420 [Acidobacteria bacterium]|nr:MAG: hypothetical protein CSA81_01420 [Acidobacteriota bacterium]PIE89018.1 MAG: hypothetical protein CR997_13555 [Acidobacteriota bacterium]
MTYFEKTIIIAAISQYYRSYTISDQNPVNLYDPNGLSPLEPASASGFQSGAWGERPNCCKADALNKRLKRIGELRNGADGEIGGINMGGAWYIPSSNSIGFTTNTDPALFGDPIKPTGDKCVDFSLRIHEWFHFTDNKGGKCPPGTTENNYLDEGGCMDIVSQQREDSAYSEEAASKKSLLSGAT